MDKCTCMEIQGEKIKDYACPYDGLTEDEKFEGRLLRAAEIRVKVENDFYTRWIGIKYDRN
jgi:hypothetical protein